MPQRGQSKLYSGRASDEPWSKKLSESTKKYLRSEADLEVSLKGSGPLPVMDKAGLASRRNGLFDKQYSAAALDANLP